MLVKDLVSYFSSALIKGRLHSAFLIRGATAAIRLYAVSHISQEVFGVNSCASPDFFSLDYAHPERKSRQITVEDVARLEAFCRLKAAHNSYRIAVIEHADCLNYNAANALLKILEEPGENTVIFMLADTIGKMLPTIRSRCCLINCHRPNYQAFIASFSIEDVAEEDLRVLFDVFGGDVILATEAYEGEAFAVIKMIRNCLLTNSLAHVHEIIAFTYKNNEGWDLVKSSMLHYMHNCLVERARRSLRGLGLGYLEKVLQMHKILTAVDVSHLDKGKVIMACLQCGS